MTLIPAVLVLIVGSNVVIRAVDQWFNEPVDEILSSANQIAGDYYRERQQVVTDQASRIAGPVVGGRSGLGRCARRPRPVDARSQRPPRRDRAGLSRRRSGPTAGSTSCPLVDVAAPNMPQGWPRASADRLAARVAAGVETEPRLLERSRRRRQPVARGQRHSQRQSPGHRRRRGERLPVGRPGRPIAPHDEGLRGLHAAARAAAAAGRRVSVVLPDGDAAHSRELDLDGLLSGQAHHATRADAVGGRPRDRPGPLRPAHRAPGDRRVRFDDRSVQHDGRGARVEPAPARARRRSISNARTRRSTAGGATSRRFSSAWRRASCRSIRPAASARSIPRPCACSKSAPSVVGQPAVDVFRPRRSAADQRRARPGGARASRTRSRRRSRSSARGASCTSRPPPRG